ncbi:hypothetical protein K8T06_08515 [bacterium]|nr:hypothetical protein [bacterium]
MVPEFLAVFDICLGRDDLEPENLPFYFILDIHGALYFWPSWVANELPESTVFDYESGYVGVGLQRINIIPSFIWPDTGNVSDSGLWFYGAILNEEHTTILGDYAAVEWGFGYL